jgi:hypothetical protein
VGRGGVRLTGGAGMENHPKNNAPSSKFKKCYFPGSKNCQNFTGERLSYQEHNATTNYQKAIKDCSQKF